MGLTLFSEHPDIKDKLAAQLVIEDRYTPLSQYNAVSIIEQFSNAEFIPLIT